MISRVLKCAIFAGCQHKAMSKHLEEEYYYLTINWYVDQVR